MSDLISRAKAYATSAHKRIDQRRKYSNQPYQVHLEAVASILATVSDDEEMIAAAWLHDVVEDTPATLGDLQKEFGDSIAKLVEQLTDISRPSDGNRAKRKEIDRLHIAQASARAKTVKLADLIDNCQDISKHDPRFASVYLQEMSALLDVLGEGESLLYKQARDLHSASLLKIESKTSKSQTTTPAELNTNLVWGMDPVRFKRIFSDLFSAKDIAEPLLSFGADKDCSEVSKALLVYEQDVASIRIHGAVQGYLLKQDCDNNGDGTCSEIMRHFTVDQVVEGDALFNDVIHVLTRHDYCFVRLLGDIVGVIDRESIDKPLVRMWLFGLITLTEMRIITLIKQFFPDNKWQDLLSATRLQKAEQLQEERLRQNQHCELVDCLQLSDKAQIIIQHQPTFDTLGFRSKKAARRVVKELEQLRNHLAHSQDIASHNWTQIVRMTQRIDEVSDSN
jgi:hypothetical protein